MFTFKKSCFFMTKQNHFKCLLFVDSTFGVYTFSKFDGQPKNERKKRAATARPERIWDYAVIPYEIEANFSGNHKALFKQVRLRKSRHANICSKNQFFCENVVVIGFSELRLGSNERYENSTFYGSFKFLTFILIFNKKIKTIL